MYKKILNNTKCKQAILKICKEILKTHCVNFFFNVYIYLSYNISILK